MSSVDAASANLLALERVQSVLQTELPAALADSNVALSGLPLPPPGLEGFHIVDDEASAKERTQTEKVAVYLWLEDRSRELARASRSPSAHSVDRAVYVSVMVAFRQAHSDSITHLSQSMSLRSVVAQRSHRYASAVKKVGLGRKFCGAAGIFATRLDNDKPATNAEVEEETIRGFSTVTFELHQWTIETIG